MSARVDISFDCREDVEIDFTIETAAGAAFDLTGKALACEILTSFTATTTLARKTTGGGITITSAAAGTGTVTLTGGTGGDTDLTKGDYVWVLACTDSGSRDVYAYGVCTVGSPRVPAAS